MVKSHVYLAKSILNRFSHKDKDKRNLIYYYNFDTNKIEESTTASFNRINGYYTDTNESILKRFSEEKIGNVINFLEKKDRIEEYDFKLPDKMKKIIKQYVAFQLIRNDSMMQIVKESMKNLNYNAPYISKNERQKRLGIIERYKKIDLKTLKNDFIEYEPSMRMFTKSVDSLGIIILFNKTNRNFVLISSTSALNPYSIGYFTMNITLTPRICITLCNKDTMKKALGISEDVFISKVVNEEFVLNYNKDLYQVAKNNKPNMLVGFEKELKEII